MLIRPLPHVTAFIDQLNEAIIPSKPSAKLSRTHKTWLQVVLMGIIVTQSLNWAAFERRSVGVYKQEWLSWVFHYASISWGLLLRSSVQMILKHYGIRQGVLVIDDTDKCRCKRTSRISTAHKVKDKATGGYFNAQELLFMVIVTDKATFPVDFRFYVPDPDVSAWRKENKQLKHKGIPASERPRCPTPDRQVYPTKQMLALEMLDAFSHHFSDISLNAVIADALYGTGNFMDKA